MDGAFKRLLMRGGLPSGGLASALLGSETSGLALAAEDMSLAIRDTTTPVNAFQGDPNVKLTYASPFTKYVRGNTGIYEAGTTLRRSYNSDSTVRGILLENASTNACLHSNDLTNAAWVKTSASAVKTATGPDGVANSASTLTASGANGLALQTITAASSTRSGAVFLKRRTGTGAVSFAIGDTTGSELVSNGAFGTDTTGWSVVGAGGSIAATGGRLRVTSTGALTRARSITTATTVGKLYRYSLDAYKGTATSYLVYIGSSSGLQDYASLGSSTDGTVTGYFRATSTVACIDAFAGQAASVYSEYDNISITEVSETTVDLSSGDWVRATIQNKTITNPCVAIKLETSGDAVDVWCAQCEALAAATSPIVTTTTAAARTADTLTLSTSLFPHDANMTFYIEFETDDVSTSSQTLFSLLGANINDYISVMNSAGGLLSRTRSGGGSTVDINAASVFSAGTVYQATIRMSDAFMAASLNGSGISLGQNTSTALSPTSRVTLAFGSWAGSNRSTAIYLRKFAAIPRAISNTEMSTKWYEHSVDTTPYDIFVIAGQSNTNSGLTVDGGLDVSGGHVWQLKQTDGTIIAADEPLRHVPVVASSIGFGLAFARDYYYPNVGKEVLLLPCGVGNTGFVDDRWDANEDLYNRVENAISIALAKCPNATLKGVLWMQGEREADSGWSQAQYEAAFDAMVAAFRVTYPGLKFVVGGMSPGYVAANAALRQPVQDAIIAAPSRLTDVAYADPASPSDISSGSSPAHYTAGMQRTYAGRWWTAWQTIA